MHAGERPAGACARGGTGARTIAVLDDDEITNVSDLGEPGSPEYAEREALLLAKGFTRDQIRESYGATGTDDEALAAAYLATCREDLREPARRGFLRGLAEHED